MLKNVKTKEEILESAVNGLLEHGRQEKEQIREILRVIVRFAADLKKTFSGRLEAMEQRIDTRLAQIKNGKDGKDGKNGQKGDTGEKGASGRDGKDSDPYKVAQIVYDLIKIPTPKEYDKEIESLRDKIKELEDTIKGSRVKRALFGANQIITQRAEQVILSAAETPNGSITDFTFAQKPRLVVVNGAQYREDKGWTFTNGKVVLSFAPATGSDVYAII